MSTSVIIAGSRSFDDYEFLSQTMNRILSDINGDITIICGKARGTDTLEERYAIEHGYSIRHFPADSKRYGKCAGYIRNTEMARNADVLVAFWNGQSHGTRHMIETAKSMGLEVYIEQH